MLNMFKRRRREPKPSFNIVETTHGRGRILKGIKCNQCKSVSYSTEDLRYLYCPKCKMFHS